MGSSEVELATRSVLKSRDSRGLRRNRSCSTRKVTKMRLPLKFRPLCLAGVAIVALLATGEALARAGGRSAGGHWVGGRGHGQHWGGGVHGGRVARGDGRRPPSLAAIGVWALAAAAFTGAAITAAAGFIMTTLALTATTRPTARRPMAAGRRSMRSAIIQGRRRATGLRPRSIRRRLTLAMRQSCPLARIRTSSIFPPRGIAGRARVAIDAWSDEALTGPTSASEKPRRRRQQPQSRQRDAI